MKIKLFFLISVVYVVIFALRRGEAPAGEHVHTNTKEHPKLAMNFCCSGELIWTYGKIFEPILLSIFIPMSFWTGILDVALLAVLEALPSRRSDNNSKGSTVRFHSFFESVSKHSLFPGNSWRFSLGFHASVGSVRCLARHHPTLLSASFWAAWLGACAWNRLVRSLILCPYILFQLFLRDYSASHALCLRGFEDKTVRLTFRLLFGSVAFLHALKPSSCNF